MKYLVSVQSVKTYHVEADSSEEAESKGENLWMTDDVFQMEELSDVWSTKVYQQPKEV